MYGTVYFLLLANYNALVMNSKVVEEKVKLTKYQVYLTKDLQEAFERYINEQFCPEDRVVTAVIRKAVNQFLKREGYL